MPIKRARSLIRVNQHSSRAEVPSFTVQNVEESDQPTQVQDIEQEFVYDSDDGQMLVDRIP